MKPTETYDVAYITLPAFLSTALMYGSEGRLEMEDLELLERAHRYIGDGIVVDVGPERFSKCGSDLPFDVLGGMVAEYTVIYRRATK